MKITRAELTTITAAGAEIQQLATDIRRSSSFHGLGLVWDEPRDKKAHDRLQRLSVRLLKLRVRLSA